ncbi:hypothetical protein LCGC14_0731630 [marine sediment metagenome]|uniref:Bacteriophage phiJL001 Gp84 C-terminal domain-containing protein n=1 Tax=marine sediment metagenome TaxID=412755 RepID=A0A0F9QUC2_9ZZZZ
MSLATIEESVEDGQPIELYSFTNLEESFRYTSGQREVILGGSTYVPTEISRTSSGKEGINTRATLVLKLPNTDPLVRRYVIGLPATPDKVVVYRQHSTDGGSPETMILFSGQIENVGFTGNEAKVNVVSTVNFLGKPMPRQTMRSMCNHILFDTRCKVVEASFSMVTTVTNISADGLTVAVDGGTNTIVDTGLQLSAQISADAVYFNGGILSRSNLEQRSILSTVDLGGNVVEFGMLIGYQSLSVGSTLTLLAGCDHNFATCRAKFSNHQQYGGFPYVPRKNPFEIGVDK